MLISVVESRATCCTTTYHTPLPPHEALPISDRAPPHDFEIIPDKSQIESKLRLNYQHSHVLQVEESKLEERPIQKSISVVHGRPAKTKDLRSILNPDPAESDKRMQPLPTTS